MRDELLGQCRHPSQFDRIERPAEDRELLQSRLRDAVAVMRVALEMAGVDASDVVAVWANAAGLSQADEPEADAIVRVLGQNVSVRTPKIKLGEPLGAGGSLNTVLALQAWQHGVDVGPVVVNSSSLGGTHISLVLVPAT